MFATKTIYLIRHGETDYNKRGVVQGSGIDAELNELGHAQAASFFGVYKDMPFKTVYTSALIRTHQSVKGFISAGVPHVILPGLNEISWGQKEGKIPNREDDVAFFSMISRWRRGETDLQVEGGESPQQVADRQQIALKQILAKPEEDFVLVAMHGRAMRILLAQICNLPLSEMDCFEHRNLCLYILQYNYETHKFKILESNNIDHLAALPV